MEIPIFPLNGAVLFPGTSLPLNIFENRYIEMVNYALSNDRLIGMIQTNKSGKLYNVGCLGKIHSFNETEDGRYLISLQGTNNFHIIKEIESSNNFRLVNVSIIKNNNRDGSFNNEQKLFLLKKYSEYLKLKKINLNLEEIEGIDTEQLIKFISMVSPFNDVDKQVLLETNNILDFYKKLISILDLELLGELSSNSIN